MFTVIRKIELGDAIKIEKLFYRFREEIEDGLECSYITKSYKRECGECLFEVNVELETMIEWVKKNFDDLKPGIKKHELFCDLYRIADKYTKVMNKEMDNILKKYENENNNENDNENDNDSLDRRYGSQFTKEYEVICEHLVGPPYHSSLLFEELRDKSKKEWINLKKK